MFFAIIPPIDLLKRHANSGQVEDLQILEEGLAATGAGVFPILIYQTTAIHRRPIKLAALLMPLLPIDVNPIVADWLFTTWTDSGRGTRPDVVPILATEPASHD